MQEKHTYLWGMINELKSRLQHTAISKDAYLEVGPSLVINADYNDIFPLLDPVDLIFADLPYGITQQAFDSIIRMEDTIELHNGVKMVQLTKKEARFLLFYNDSSMTTNKFNNWFESKKVEGLWSKYDKVLKPNGTIVLTATLKFASYLIETAKDYGFKLQTDWVWEKTQATGGLNAKIQPLRAHELVLVFARSKSKGLTYNPQKTDGHKPVNSHTKYISTQNKTEVYGKVSKEISGGGNTDRYPRSVLTFKSDKQTNYLHGNQKPLKLVEYFIQTYSNPGDVVLDNVGGSLTTAEATNNTGRRSIVIEKGPEYFQKGLTRFKI